MPFGELRQPVAEGWCTRQDRFILQKSFHIRSETGDRVIAASAVLFQTLHHDPIQIASQKVDQPWRGKLPTLRGRSLLLSIQTAQPRRGTDRILLEKHPPHSLK